MSIGRASRHPQGPSGLGSRGASPTSGEGTGQTVASNNAPAPGQRPIMDRGKPPRSPRKNSALFPLNVDPNYDSSSSADLGSAPGRPGMELSTINTPQPRPASPMRSPAQSTLPSNGSLNQDPGSEPEPHRSHEPSSQDEPVRSFKFKVGLRRDKFCWCLPAPKLSFWVVRKATREYDVLERPSPA